MSSLITYVDVILPLALPQAYTYAVPVDLVPFVKTGQRVVVQFGKNKHYSAIVKSIHNRKPVVDAKLIETIVEEEPVVTEMQLKFWSWLSNYYMCTEGEVMNAALPSGLKLSSETRIKYNESYDGDFDSLSDDEFTVVQALRAQHEIKIPDVQELLRKKNVYPVLRNLFDIGVAISDEELIEKFKPKTVSYIQLNPAYSDDDKLESLYNELSRAPKQVELLLAFTQLGKKTKHIKKSELLELSKSSTAVLSALVKKGVFIEYKAETSRIGNIETETVDIPELSAEQKIAINAIQEQFESKDVVLLHGITGSGKTNIYFELIAEVLAQNKQVLYLLPEIALTAQIINRLRKVFGNLVGIYHSKFNQHERVEIWNKVLRNEYKIVIGARSAVFLPFQDLGLAIVDEEHDAAFKQVDPTPRYNGRDTAIVLASMFKAKVLLGTATPAIETYYNCEKGKYGLVTLNKRYNNSTLPVMEVVNIRNERKWKSMHGNFSGVLVENIRTALQNKEQVILFLNRRGFANYQTCKTCGYIYKCKNCDVSLTYHKYANQLRCHYCGYSENVIERCKSCGAIDLDIVGSGTEKIETEIAELFPEARVNRLDYDAMKTKHGYAKVISEFENREIDILVGTQMVSKGLDFDHVSTVGIMNADQLIHFPGYRSHERAFQLMTQVAGRAGRKNRHGKVIIQTGDPEQAVIQQVIHNDCKGMYETELLTRRQFHYPPFIRMISVTLRHKNVKTVDQGALLMANEMRKKSKAKVLGPATPFISKINNYYIREVIFKSFLNTQELHQTKDELQKVIDFMKAQKELKSIDINITVDA